MIIAGIEVTEQEGAVLLATRVSENAQSLEQLAQNVESDPVSVQSVIAMLVEHGLLEPIENFDNTIVYGYTASWQSQAIYDAIHKTGE